MFWDCTHKKSCINKNRIYLHKKGFSSTKKTKEKKSFSSNRKIWTQKPKEKVRKCIKYVSETPEKHLIDQFSLSRQIVNGINVLNYPSKSLHLSALDIRIPPNSSLSLKAQNSLDFWIHPTTCQEMIIVFKYVCHLNTIPMIRSGLYNVY